MSEGSRAIKPIWTAALVAVALAFVFAGQSRAAVPAVSAGFSHTCVLKDDGQVRCFGTNLYGQLGIAVNSGTTTRNTTPTTVPLPTTAVAIGVDGSHSCAVLSNNTSYCFGLNDSGQIGDGAPTGIGANHTPVLVDLDAAGVSADPGNFFTCVLDVDSNLECFGNNNHGQLATTTNNGDNDPNPVPALAPVGGPVKASSGGNNHNCAVLATGALRCFGNNYNGQIGTATNVTTDTPNPTPVTVDIDGPALNVSAGASHTCALRSDGVVLCFGDNASGQMGTGANSVANPDPEPVVLGAPAVQVVAGGYHSCALLTGGTLKCWGLNDYGQLGRSEGNGMSTPFPVPTTVSLPGPAVAVAAGFKHTCAILADGGIACFGNNNGGQLGNTAAGYNFTPTVISGLKLFTPAPTGPGGSPPPTGKLIATVAKPRFKSKRRRGKLRVTATVRLTATGLAAAECAGRLTARAAVGRKRVARKTFALKYSGGRCTASVALAIAKKYDGKKATVSLGLDSTTLDAAATKATVKL